MNFRKMSLFVVFALVAISLSSVNRRFPRSPSQAKILRADGGLPMPPPPPTVLGSSVSQGSTLMADGGLPMPPPPPSPSGTVAVVS